MRPGFNPWLGKIPWRRERLPTPVFWPGEFPWPGEQPMGSRRVWHDWATFTFPLGFAAVFIVLFVWHLKHLQRHLHKTTVGKMWGWADFNRRKGLRFFLRAFARGRSKGLWLVRRILLEKRERSRNGEGERPLLQLGWTCRGGGTGIWLVCDLWLAGLSLENPRSFQVHRALQPQLIPVHSEPSHIFFLHSSQLKRTSMWPNSSTTISAEQD